MFVVKKLQVEINSTYILWQFCEIHTKKKKFQKNNNSVIGAVLHHVWLPACHYTSKEWVALG